MKPVIAATGASTEVRGEEELVARAREGSSEAFEALFRRYRERITAYVRTIIPDHARAEDVVQEIFVSALRKLHTLEEPSAFKAWIYEIARNACLDDVRRAKRSGEIFIRSNDLAPYDDQPSRAPSTHGKVSWREQLRHLKEALGGLPESQHEALVLREFGGMSYDEIGRQMNLSRAAVESMLFRARRGLKDEFSDISTGERCRRMQGVMAEIAEGLGGMRDRRLLLRHIRDCAVCRREATAMGFAGVALPPEHGRFRRTISRAAALLPLPFLFNRRPEGSEQVSGGASLGAQAQGLATQVTVAGNVSADHVSSAIHKAAAVVAAVAVIGGGAGVAVEQSGVRIPVLGSKGKHEEATLGSAVAGGQPAQARIVGSAVSTLHGGPPAQGPGAPAGTAGDDHGGVPLSPSAEPGAGVPGSDAVPGDGNETTPTTDGSSPLVPAPTTDVPADNGSTQDTGGSGTGGSDSGGTGSSQGGGTTDPSSSQGNPPASEGSGGGAQLSPDFQTLPPGIQQQILSGKRSIDDLPPGLRKKLGSTSTAPGA